MTDPVWYWPLVWGLIVAGLGLSSFFLATFRPSRRWPPRLRDVDTAGMVWVIFLLMLVSASRAATGYPPPSSPAIAVGNIAMGVLIDGLLLVRAVHWQRVRRQFNNDPNRAAVAADERRT